MQNKNIYKDIGSRCLAVRTLSTARAVGRQFDNALRPCGLTISQFTLLVSVAGRQPDSITELAQELSMERTALSRNLKLLEKEGWISRGEEGTARKRKLMVSQSGIEKLQQAYPLWRNQQEQLEQLLEDQLETTKSVLATLRGQTFFNS